MGELFHRIALTVNSSLELREVLKRLADLTLEAIPADRCNLFLLDESGERVLPTFSRGRMADPSLWERFKAMEPVDLKSVPARWKMFCAGRALAIPDVATSSVVPTEFVEIFGSRSALIAPLVAGGEPLGVFSLDWTAPGRDFDEDEVALFEAIGGYAALAVRNARLYEKLLSKAHTLERLVGVAAALNSSPSLRSVLDLICGAFEDVLGTTHCSVNLVDAAEPHRIRTIAVRGVSWFAGRIENLATISPNEIARVRDLWKSSPEPVIYSNVEQQEAVDSALIPPSVRSVALFPLVNSGKLQGAVVAGFPQEGGPPTASVETGHALADLAGTAVGRAGLHEDLRKRFHLTEVLYRLSDVVAGTADLTSALRKLNRVLLPEVGIKLGSIFVANSNLREAVGASAPGKEELEAIRSWRAVIGRGGYVPKPRAVDGGFLIPIIHRNRVQGVLLVEPIADERLETDENFLIAVGSGCAEVILKAGLRWDLSEAERRLAVSAERERIARDLHDSVGQLLTGIGLTVSEYLSEAPDRLWRKRLEEIKKLAGQGSRDVRQAIYSMLFFQVRRNGLARSLRELCSKFEATNGISVKFKIEGAPIPLSSKRDDALFRVVHEALMNVERHSRASNVNVHLRYLDAHASLSVRDDGVGLAQRDPFGAKEAHFGLRALQRLIEEAGGSLEVRNANPRGVLVTASMPEVGVGKGSM